MTKVEQYLKLLVEREGVPERSPEYEEIDRELDVLWYRMPNNEFEVLLLRLRNGEGILQGQQRG